MYLIGEKEFAASPPLFDKRSGCYGNGLIDAAEKLNILKRFLTPQVACMLSETAAVKIRREHIWHLPFCIPFL